MAGWGLQKGVALWEGECVAEGGWNDCCRPGNMKWSIWNEGGAENGGNWYLICGMLQVFKFDLFCWNSCDITSPVLSETSIYYFLFLSVFPQPMWHVTLWRYTEDIVLSILLGPGGGGLKINNFEALPQLILVALAVVFEADVPCGNWVTVGFGSLLVRPSMCTGGRRNWRVK